jgi:hypothetical protein
MPAPQRRHAASVAPDKVEPPSLIFVRPIDVGQPERTI